MDPLLRGPERGAGRQKIRVGLGVEFMFGVLCARAASSSRSPLLIARDVSAIRL